MRFDVTRLPLGEALVGFVLTAVVVTFVLAFAFPTGSGLPDEAVAEPSPTAEPTGTLDGGGGGGGGTEVALAMIPIIQFDTDQVTVPAGQPVTLTADNQDTGIPHNWALYESQSVAESQGPSAALALTNICADCTETVTFDPPAPGEYFFRCDVHPLQMIGTFTVQ